MPDPVFVTYLELVQSRNNSEELKMLSKKIW